MGASALRELVREGPLLSVGVLTADLGHLADELALLEAGGVRARPHRRHGRRLLPHDDAWGRRS